MKVKNFDFNFRTQPISYPSYFEHFQIELFWLKKLLICSYEFADNGEYMDAAGAGIVPEAGITSLWHVAG